MFRALQILHTFTLHATDGQIGHVRDFLFDDQDWIVRHAVVETGSWLGGRQVLIPREALRELHQDKQELSVSLTRDQVQHSPDIATDRPIDHQQEADLFHYYGWKPYWGTGAPILPGLSGFEPGVIPPSQDRLATTGEGVNPHLRSAQEIKGYLVVAADGELGRVLDQQIDETAWAVRHLVVDLGVAEHHRQILLVPTEISAIDWVDQHLETRLRRAEMPTL